jgi:outer membrane protein, multidrug efflux system
LQKQVDQLQLVSVQTQAQLEVGVVSQLDVFENERSLLTAQDALLESYQQVLSDTVTLYKALGGGWTGLEVTNASR